MTEVILNTESPSWGVYRTECLTLLLPQLNAAAASAWLQQQGAATPFAQLRQPSSLTPVIKAQAAHAQVPHRHPVPATNINTSPLQNALLLSSLDIIAVLLATATCASCGTFVLDYTFDTPGLSHASLHRVLDTLGRDDAYRMLMWQIDVLYAVPGSVRFA